MSQIEMFASEPPAPTFEHGGYMPPATRTYRAEEFLAKYKDLHGLITLEVPTLFWLMDRVIEVLRGGTVHWYDMDKAIGLPVDRCTLSRHLDLMASRGLIHAEPVYFGSSSPHLGNYRGFQYRYSLPEGVPS
ncbi:hypothetical protein [Marinobacter subterrani]|uniref:Uncharacterized protein n=1 Tax=Marinobacter subterrani TaxID=1658765 RepID=A0A0J7M2L5_9GAMM|nr:hypothetical protein [Marinobacter subterrani]KMQ75255.1 hypothetical protein Msub_11456 [Marinobacter subterrani]